MGTFGSRRGPRRGRYLTGVILASVLAGLGLVGAASGLPRTSAAGHASARATVGGARRVSGARDVISSSGAPAASATAKAASADPVASAAQLGGGLGVNFGKWLLDKVGGAAAQQGAGFIFSVIGLNDILHPNPTVDLLNEVKVQLGKVSQQISDVQTSINTLTSDVRTGQLDLDLRLLDDKTTLLNALFNRKFQTVADAADTLEKAKAAGADQQTIDKDVDELMRSRDDFYNEFDKGPFAAMPEYIHKFLVPGSASSILAAKGKVILSKSRYLTTASSMELRRLYDAVAAEEELASWMLIERDIPTVTGPLPYKPPPYPTSPGSIKNYELARQQALDYRISEQVNLPPVIPNGVVIDTGKLGADTTNNATMWLPAATNLRFQPGVEGKDTVPDSVVGLNARYADGFNDWRIPSQASLTTLLGGFTPAPGTTPDTFLSGLNPTTGWQQIGRDSFLWSTDLVTQKVACYEFIGKNNVTRNLSFPVVTHTAVSTTTPSAAWSGRPQIPREAPTSNINLLTEASSNVCGNFVRDQWAGSGAAGGFLAERSTGVMPMDYMAQGPGPHLRPGANLRNADLEGFNLTGVDLSGADLAGARLTGARFSDDLGTRKLNLTGAQLSGVTSGAIEGHATLPTGWQLHNGYLVGAGARLIGADLRDADLSGATLLRTVSGGVDCTGCRLPAGWRWTGLPSGYFVGPGPNLEGADLRGLDLQGLSLADANLTGANLSGANLARSNLAGADLTRADLSHVNLTGVNLARANVSDANFTAATMRDVSSRGGVVGTPAALPTDWHIRKSLLVGPDAFLQNADLSGADLADTTLTGAVVTYANLSNAKLTGARLSRVNFSGSDLGGANLTGADLTGANLFNDNLTNAVLTNATLLRAYLTGANISGATFTTDNDNKLAGIRASGLIGTPKALPVSGRFRVVEGYLLGPSGNLGGVSFTSGAQIGISLSGANFTNANLAGLNLTGAYMNFAILSGARLTGTTLTGVNMSAATLNGVSSGAIIGTPLLPAGWRFINGYIVGRGADLAGANLNGANLTGVDLSAANLTDAQLVGANFSGASLNGAELTGAVLTGATWASTTCPNAVQQSTPCAPVAVWRGPANAVARANNTDGTLLIDVAPAIGIEWRVTIEQLLDNGGWKDVSEHRTKGPGDTLTINLPNGTYRAVVPRQNGFLGWTSKSVDLAK